MTPTCLLCKKIPSSNSVKCDFFKGKVKVITEMNSYKMFVSVENVYE